MKRRFHSFVKRFLCNIVGQNTKHVSNYWQISGQAKKSWTCDTIFLATFFEFVQFIFVDFTLHFLLNVLEIEEWCFKKHLLCHFTPSHPPKKRNPVHSITLYWPDFQSLNSPHSNVKIFKMTLTKSFSSWLNASFDTFWVQIDRIL